LLRPTAQGHRFNSRNDALVPSLRGIVQDEVSNLMTKQSPVSIVRKWITEEPVRVHAVGRGLLRPTAQGHRFNSRNDALVPSLRGIVQDEVSNSMTKQSPVSIVCKWITEEPVRVHAVGRGLLRPHARCLRLNLQ
jgi:hypothetical protein